MAKPKKYTIVYEEYRRPNLDGSLKIFDTPFKGFKKHYKVYALALKDNERDDDNWIELDYGIDFILDGNEKRCYLSLEIESVLEKLEQVWGKKIPFEEAYGVYYNLPIKVLHPVKKIPVISTKKVLDT